MNHIDPRPIKRKPHPRLRPRQLLLVPVDIHRRNIAAGFLFHHANH